MGSVTASFAYEGLLVETVDGQVSGVHKLLWRNNIQLKVGFFYLVVFI